MALSWSGGAEAAALAGLGPNKCSCEVREHDSLVCNRAAGSLLSMGLLSGGAQHPLPAANSAPPLPSRWHARQCQRGGAKRPCCKLASLHTPISASCATSLPFTSTVVPS